MEIALGKGPCIKIQGAGMIADTRIVNWMVHAAEKNKIPYQREVLLMEDSDASRIQLARAGVPSGCISVPIRYIHSPSEMVDISDVQNAVKLLTAVLHTPVGL
jgi:endoglucanase